MRQDASKISQMKILEDENRRLKRMFADLSMQADLLKEALGVELCDKMTQFSEMSRPTSCH